MDLPTQTHLSTLRNLLMFRIQELQHDVRAARLARNEPFDANAPSEVTDRKDQALAQQLSDIDEAQERRDLAELSDATDALTRLNEGRYGDCLDCGEPVPLKRLMAQPAVKRCMACQVAFERQPQVVRPS
jgi:DnaK suppressor protein